MGDDAQADKTTVRLIADINVLGVIYCKHLIYLVLIMQAVLTPKYKLYYGRNKLYYGRNMSAYQVNYYISARLAILAAEL